MNNEVHEPALAPETHHGRWRTEIADVHQADDSGPGAHPDIRSFAERYGLHPLVAAAMIALDYMLFVTLEVPSMELLAVISAFVGFAAVLPCTLIQKYAYHDSTGAAWGKGMLVGLLTAVPTPLPSFLTIAWGITGFVGMRARARAAHDSPRDPNTVDKPN